MAKRRKRKTSPAAERTVHCSGPEWEGDGSRASSACPFGHSMQTTAARYKCGHCATKTTPDKVLADENGLTEAGRRAPLPPPSPPGRRRRRRPRR